MTLVMAWSQFDSRDTNKEGSWTAALAYALDKARHVVLVYKKTTTHSEHHALELASLGVGARMEHSSRMASSAWMVGTDRSPTTLFRRVGATWERARRTPRGGHTMRRGRPPKGELKRSNRITLALDEYELKALDLLRTWLYDRE